MIQRKQTLFLLALFFAALSLTVINCNFLDVRGAKTGVSLLIIPNQDLKPSIWHYLGGGIDLIILLLSVITIFLFKNRELQIKLCYVLMLLQLALTAVVSFCPVVDLQGYITYENSGLASIIGIIGMMAAYLAARFIKKDIELLKSADRIR